VLVREIFRIWVSTPVVKDSEAYHQAASTFYVDQKGVDVPLATKCYDLSSHNPNLLPFHHYNADSLNLLLIS
jgi:hypothetical protein